MFERFGGRARRIMDLAYQEAVLRKSEFIGTEDILAAIVREGEGLAARVLQDFGVALGDVRREIQDLTTESDSPAVPAEQLPFSPRARQAIERASECATRFSPDVSQDVIGAEHLLLGLLGDDDATAALVMGRLNLKLDRVRDRVMEVIDL